MADPMRTVSFKLPQRLDRALTNLARRCKSSRSAVVRDALEALMTSKRPPVTAAVHQLVGPRDGPVDLSTDPKHMTGYGK